MQYIGPPLATAAPGYNAAHAKGAIGAQFEELFEGVDDLIKRVADTENPEIRKIRAKVHATMTAARNACRDRVEAGAGAREEEYPESLGVALLVGLGLGVIMSTQP